MSKTSEQGEFRAAGTMRKVPRQARARRRVASILEAARGLVVEYGSDSMKMSEVASRAGISIGSLYQYFPDKPAILRELALEFMDRVRTQLREATRNVSAKADAIHRTDAVIDGYYQLLLTDPGSRDIWASTQSDKQLQALDIEDSRTNGAILADALRHLVPDRQHGELLTVCVLFAHLAGATARFAISVEPEEGDRLMAAFRATVQDRLQALLVDLPSGDDVGGG